MRLILAAGSDIDSLLQLGLDGADNKFGFLDISIRNTVVPKLQILPTTTLVFLT